MFTSYIRIQNVKKINQKLQSKESICNLIYSSSKTLGCSLTTFQFDSNVNSQIFKSCLTYDLFNLWTEESVEVVNTCGYNEEYLECGSGCPATCQDLDKSK